MKFIVPFIDCTRLLNNVGLKLNSCIFLQNFKEIWCRIKAVLNI